jgi:hypothetical protein
MGSSASIMNKKTNESNYLIQNPLKKEDTKQEDTKQEDTKQEDTKEHIVATHYGNKFNYNDEFQKYQYR